MERKRVLLDCRMYGMSGVGRYIENLLSQIIKARLNDFVFDLLDYNDKLIKYRGNKNINEIIESNLKPLSLRESIIGTWFFKKMSNKYDLIHFTHFNIPLIIPKNSIITIHDLIPVKLPQYFPWYKSQYLKKLLQRNFKRVKKIIAVSQYTANDIFNIFHVDNQKVEIIYEQVKAKTVQSTSKWKKKFGDYFLYVGNRKEHKNIDTAIKAFDKIFDVNKNYKFVIVGKKFKDYDYVDKTLKEVRNRNNFVTMEKVTDKELWEIYTDAYAFISVSKYEGFGLPVIEAMNFKKPCIVSKTTALGEITDDAALKVNPKDIKTIEDAILALINDKELYNRLSKKSEERSKYFTKYDEISRVLRVYKNVLYDTVK